MKVFNHLPCVCLGRFTKERNKREIAKKLVIFMVWIRREI
jgi:hypothetical protein